MKTNDEEIQVLCGKPITAEREQDERVRREMMAMIAEQEAKRAAVANEGGESPVAKAKEPA